MNAPIQHPARPGLSAGPVEISVVVSTRNRCTELPRLFEALAAQTINGKVPWELIIVDNCSTDETARVSQDLAASANFPVTCAYEGRRGKSCGLNAGIGLARGFVIALTDDDGVPAPDWLANIQEYFANHSDISCVGGRVELYNSADALVTVRLAREAAVVDSANFSPVNIPVIGCNMALKSGVLRAVGPFDTDLGPGGPVGVAEDVDMLFRLVRGGFAIGYDPHLLVLHNHGRRTAREVGQVQESYVVGRGAFYCKYILEGDRRAIRTAYWEVSGLLRAAVGAGLITLRARDAWRMLRLLGVGFGRYVWKRAHRRAEQRPSHPLADA